MARSSAHPISWRTKLALVFFSLIFASLLGEIALRVLKYNPPEILTADVRSTYHMVPNGAFIYRGYLDGMFSDFANPVKLNSLGFHDIEHPVARKSTDTFRVMIIGDSYVAALSCPLEETFFRRLEGKLKQNNPLNRSNYEVIACGQGNQAQAKETQYVTSLAPIYKPDLTLLLFFCGNDFMENWHETFDQARFFASQYKKNIATRKIALFQNLLVLPQSRLNGLIAETTTSLYAEHLNWFNKDFKKEDLLSPELGVYQVPLVPVWQKAYDATADLLIKLKNECDKNGAPLVIAILSGPQAIGDKGWSKIFQNASDHFDPLQPERWLTDWCEQNAVPYVSLEPALSRAGKKRVFWQHDGHLNPKGNAAVVDPIYQLIVKQADG